MEQVLNSNQEILDTQSELDKNLRVLGREVEETLNKKLLVLEQIYGVFISAKINFEIKENT